MGHQGRSGRGRLAEMGQRGIEIKSKSKGKGKGKGKSKGKGKGKGKSKSKSKSKSKGEGNSKGNDPTLANNGPGWGTLRVQISDTGLIIYWHPVQASGWRSMRKSFWRSEPTR